MLPAADKTAATCLDEIRASLEECKHKAEELRSEHAKVETANGDHQQKVRKRLHYPYA